MLSNMMKVDCSANFALVFLLVEMIKSNESFLPCLDIFGQRLSSVFKPLLPSQQVNYYICEFMHTNVDANLKNIHINSKHLYICYI